MDGNQLCVSGAAGGAITQRPTRPTRERKRERKREKELPSLTVLIHHWDWRTNYTRATASHEPWDKNHLLQLHQCTKEPSQEGDYNSNLNILSSSRHFLFFFSRCD